MIVKNEEKNLSRSLSSIMGLVDEIIVVDTGSTDHTPEVAKKLGAKVYHFEWCDDFSAARNFALEQASCPWIFSLDADEEISTKDHSRIKELTNNKQIYGFQLIQRNYVFNLNINGTVPCRGEYLEERDFKGYLPVPVIRLFRNDPRIRFRMPVHELVSYSMEEHGLPYSSTSIPIHHFGYAITGNTKNKLIFYQKLGEKKLQKAPDDFMAYYELGVSCLRTGNTYEAIELLEKSVQLKPDFHQSRMMLGTAYMSKGDLRSAIVHLETAVKLCPKDFGALNNLGNIYRSLGKYPEAKSYLERAIAVAPDNPVILHNIGLLYRDMWAFKTAEHFFMRVLQLSNDSIESMLELAKLLGKQGRREQAKQYAKKAIALDASKGEATQILNILDTKPVRISLCMIVRDEEKNLKELLPSVANLFDEMVIVDTGSKDSTKQVAREYNARVFDFKWCDDFSAARNFSIAKATGDYILWLDADERISLENKNRFLALKWKLSSQKDPISFLFTIRSSFGPEMHESVFQQLRLFPRIKGVHFEGKVQEQLSPALHKMNIPVRSVDIIIEHTGYQDERKRLEKVKRRLNILEKEKPGLFTFLHKANLLGFLGDQKQARSNLEMALRHEKELMAHTGWYEKAVTDLARILVKEGEMEHAKQLLTKALQCKPDSFLPLAKMGELLLDKNEPATALPFLQKAASVPLELGPVPLCLREEKSHLYLLLGECHYALNNLEDALGLYRESLRFLSHNPRTHSSLRDLAHAFEARGDYHLAISALELLPSPLTLKDQVSLMCLALKTGNKDLFARHAELLMEQLGLDTDLEINSLEELARLLLSIAESFPNTPDRQQLIEIIGNTLQPIRPHISSPDPNLAPNTPKTIQVLSS